MDKKIILTLKTKEEFYSWMKKNSLKFNEIFLKVKRGNPKNIKDELSYIDAVYVALCFGWIDSTLVKINNETYNRFTPRKLNSNWTQLNIERVKYLIKKNLMTDLGLKVCLDLNKEYKFPTYIIKELKKDKEGYDFFVSTPVLYQKIRISNIDFYFKLDKKLFNSSLKNLIKNNHLKKLFGQWNDFGILY